MQHISLLHLLESPQELGVWHISFLDVSAIYLSTGHHLLHILTSVHKRYILKHYQELTRPPAAMIIGPILILLAAQVVFGVAQISVGIPLSPITSTTHAPPLPSTTPSIPASTSTSQRPITVSSLPPQPPSSVNTSPSAPIKSTLPTSVASSAVPSAVPSTIPSTIPSTVPAPINVCGEVLNSTSGIIELPFNGSSANLTCIWTFNILSPQTPYLYIDFREIYLSADDILEISDGLRVHRFFSGNVEPFFLISDLNSAEIKVNTSTADGPRRLIISFSADRCLKTFDNQINVINAPLFTPRTTPAIVHCQWHISAAWDLKVALFFHEIVLRTGLLSVTNEGQETPVSVTNRDFVSKSDKLSVSLLVSLEDFNDTFKASFIYASSFCSGEFYFQDPTKPVTFASPKIYYTTGHICVAILKSNNTLATIAGHINTVQNTNQTVADSWATTIVNDGGKFSPNLLVHSSVTNSDLYFVSTGNQVWIQYVQYGSGVQVEISANSQSVGSAYYGNGQLIMKPQEDNVNGTSVFLLTVAPDQQIAFLPWDEPELEGSDEVIIYESNTKDVVVAKFSNRTHPFPVISNTNKLMITTTAYHGEPIHFKFNSFPKECSLVSTSSSGNFQLPNLKSYVGLNCQIVINPIIYKENDVISLCLSKIHLEGNDTITIYDDYIDEREAVLHLDNSILDTNDVWVYSDADDGLLIEFVPDIRINRTVAQEFVFTATYETRNDCGGTFHITEEFELKSPKYPDTYPANSNCSWTLIAPSTKKLLLTFEEIELVAGGFLEIYDYENTSSLRANLTGIDLPDDFLSVSNSITIRLKSSASGISISTGGRGFSINVQVLDCGGQLQESNGNFFTPGYPALVNYPQTCVWVVAIPSLTYEGKVQIIQYQYEEQKGGNDDDILEVHDGGSLRNPLLPAGTKSAIQHQSKVNKLVVKFESDGSPQEAFAFKVSYSTFVCSDKSLCENGLCMHREWMCNGVNDCGDYSDEKNCVRAIIDPTPETAEASVSVAVLISVLVVCLIIGIALGVLIPRLVQNRMKRNRYEIIEDK